MSYMRWSSGGYRCDLYCYEDCEGTFVVHVANSRYEEGYPKRTPEACFKNGMYKHGVDPEADRLWQEHWDENERHLFPIDLPHAGESFYLPDIESMLEKVLELVSIGYVVPSECIDGIVAEINEEKDNGRS